MYPSRQACSSSTVIKNFWYRDLFSSLKIRLRFVDTRALSVLLFSLSPMYMMDWLFL